MSACTETPGAGVVEPDAASVRGRWHPSTLLARMPLRRKLLVGIAVPMLCIVMVSFMLLITLEMRNERREIDRAMHSIVVAMTNDFHRMFLMNDQEAALEINERLQAFEEIDRFWLFDSYNQPVLNYARQGLTPTSPPVSGSDDFLEIPLIVHDRQLGSVIIEPSLGERREAVIKLFLSGLAVASLIAGVGLGLARIVGRTIAAPITTVSRFVVETARTLDTSSRISVNDQQEVGALARSINRLLEVMTDQRTALQETNTRIEAEVEQRTRELRMTERRIRTLATYAPVGIFETNPDGICIFVNRAWTEITGVGPDIAIGQRWLEVIHADDRDRVETEWRESIDSQTAYTGECRIARPEAELVWVSSGAVGLRDEGGTTTGFLGTLTDLTDRKRLEEELRFGAYHDRLTGLPNRMMIRARIDEVLEAMSKEVSKAGGGSVEPAFALLYLDFDRFKAINDVHGHHVGDLFLKEATERIQRTCDTLPREHDAVAMPARMGGDEFIILLEHVPAAAVVTKLAAALCDALSEPYELDGRQVSSSASIGVVMGVLEHHSTDEVLRDADTAMYCRKLEGRNGFAVFDPSMHTTLIQRERLGQELEKALEVGEFVLHYQPIISLNTRQPVGFEALLRWEHPNRGLLAPAEFLEIAEEYGLTVPIGRWAMREACAQIRRWQAWMPDPEPLFVSVNISRRHLDESSIVDDAERAVNESGVRPSSLMLEITENAIMHDVEGAIRALSALREIGVQLAMDDFGTGHSSLACLRQLPIGTLKIDRSFVQGLTGNRITLAILHAIITLAENLQMRVVVEGVERGEEVAPLIALECQLAQGYLFGRPMTAEQIPAWCVRNSAPPYALAE